MITEAVLHTHLYVKKREVSDVDKLKEAMTLVAKYDNRVVPMYVERKDWIGLPLAHPSTVKLIGNLGQIDDRRAGGSPIDFQMKFPPRDDDQRKVREQFSQLTANGATGIALNARTGFGKCLGKGTKVLLFDGTVKNVEDIVIGDRLMGPDSKPRTVLSLARGREELVRIVQNKGEAYVVNKSHILSLKQTGNSVKSGGIFGAVKYSKGRIVNISVDEYRKKSNRFRHLFKGWKSPIEFNKKELPEELPPYLLGLWLGDGTAKSPQITTTDKEVVSYLSDYAKMYGMWCLPSTGHSITWTIANMVHGQANPFRRALDSFNLLSNKHIPHVYKTSDRQDRFELLAGLIDSDGCISKQCGCSCEIIQKRRYLADDIAFVARSLGFSASVKSVNKTCTNNGKLGVYYRVIISGRLTEIPLKVVRKQVRLTDPAKIDVLLTGIKLISLGEGDYYGFQLDGDGLFLLGDFTVTHNTWCLLDFISQLKVTTLVIVPRDFIVEQWIERILAHTTLERSDIGRVQGDVCAYRDKKIVVGMIHTLCTGRHSDTFRRYFGCVVWDEVHVLGAETFSETAKIFPAKYRLGTSATMRRSDGLDKVFRWTICQRTITVEAKHADVPRILRVAQTEPLPLPGWQHRVKDKVRRLGMIITAAASSQVRNEMVVKFAESALRKGRRVLILSHRKYQLKYLQTRILERNKGLTKDKVSLFVQETPQTLRRRIVERSDVILATYQIFAMAVDTPPDVAMLILATPISDAEQAVGRVLRQGEDKPRPVVVDIVDTRHKETVNSSMARLRLWRKMGAEVIGVDSNGRRRGDQENHLSNTSS